MGSILFLLHLKVFKQLNLPPQAQISLCDEKGDVDRASRPWEIIPAGHKIGDPKPLFEELVSVHLLCYMFMCHLHYFILTINFGGLSRRIGTVLVFLFGHTYIVNIKNDRKLKELQN